ncbi:MAG: hypothetical protein JXM79_03070, partial [Sedimentisphaerales bacterium]|nr:hypothetical protein [Sedimentisphaerales bacterium]
GGIRTPGTGVYPYDGLANRCLKPLGHLSKHFKMKHLYFFQKTRSYLTTTLTKTNSRFTLLLLDSTIQY